MKFALITAAMVTMLAGSANASEGGHVSTDQLAAMGLHGMTVLSDVEGEEIRGEGFVFASSTSFTLLTFLLFTAGDFTTIYAGDLDGINDPPLQTQSEAQLEIESVVPPINIRVTGSSSGFAAGGTIAPPTP